jgi:hypothetical protein
LGNRVVWRTKKNLPHIPAPLLYKDVFYLVKKGGIITSLEPATGRVLKEGRSPDALGDYYASPIAAEGKVFLASVDGKVTVLKAGGEWQVLGVNDIGEAIHATPALGAAAFSYARAERFTASATSSGAGGGRLVDSHCQPACHADDRGPDFLESQTHANLQGPREVDLARRVDHAEVPTRGAGVRAAIHPHVEDVERFQPEL